jgi:hypothetical protein
MARSTPCGRSRAVDPLEVPDVSRVATELDALLGTIAMQAGARPVETAAHALARLTGSDVQALLAGYAELMITRGHEAAGSRLPASMRDAIAHGLSDCPVPELAEIVEVWWRIFLRLKYGRHEAVASDEASEPRQHWVH